MALSKEFKVGLLALVAGVVLYLGFNYLKGIEIFSDKNTYYAVYDKIGGLQVSNPVHLNGLPVGRVNAIEILEKENHKLKVEIKVRDDLQIGSQSVAVLTDGGLLGGKVIDLKISNEAPILDDGAEMKSSFTQGLTGLMTEKAMPVLSNFESTIVAINRLANEYAGMSGDIKKIFHNLEGTTGELKLTLQSNRQKINRVLQNIETLSESLLNTQKQLTPLLTNLQGMSDSLKRAPIAATINKTHSLLSQLEKTTQQLNSTKGTAGLLLNSDSLYRHIDKTVQDLDQLFIDIKQKPKRYVHFSLFGKKDKKKTKKEQKQKSQSETSE